MSKQIPVDHAIAVVQLSKWLQQHQGSAKVLSLDCFDTLLWRTVSDPKQVFNELQRHPLFRQWRLTAATRVLAERRAREESFYTHGNSEVTIEEIYRHAVPHADEATIASLVELEIEAEKSFLFVFRPVLDLMRQARNSGLKVVIASDMYIRRPHLKALIDSSLEKIGESFEPDAWYTSSESRCSKSQGLHLRIASDLGVPVGQIIHLGDSAHADYFGARAAGAQGFYLHRFGPMLDECLKQNRVAQLMLSDGHGERTPVVSTFHPVWSALPEATNLQEVLGWYYIGPMMAHFIRSLQAHVKASCDPRRKTRLVFMMRDGHLPLQTCKLFRQFGFNTPNTTIHSVDVSRLSLIGASFRSEYEIAGFLRRTRGHLQPMEVLRQLSTPQDPAQLFDLSRYSPSMSVDEFEGYATEEGHLRQVLEKARMQREALTRYLADEVDPQSGDQVVLVDLGYSGTIQDHLAPLMTEAFACEVQGYYFLLKDTDRAPSTKHGFLSSRDVASATVDLLLAQIQTLEQLSCNDNGSVYGFSAKGRPLFEANLLAPEQLALKAQVQMATTDLLSAGLRPYMALPLTSAEILHDALGLLGRFLLHPTPEELDFYSRFSHDINNGTKRRRFISNLGRTRDALLRGGLMSFNIEHHKMFANDLVAFSPALATYSWTKARFNLKHELIDFRDNTVALQAIASSQSDFREIPVSAFHTHEGYRVALVSIQPDMQALGLNLGKFYNWVQIYSAGLVSKQHFIGNPHWSDAVDLKPLLQVMEGQEHAPGLVEFRDANGFLYLPLQGVNRLPKGEFMLALVYRPLKDQATVVGSPSLPEPAMRATS